MTEEPKNENNQDPYVVEAENNEELGGDSEEVKEDNEFHRPEQDESVVSKDVGLPATSTR